MLKVSNTRTHHTDKHEFPPQWENKHLFHTAAKIPSLHKVQLQYGGPFRGVTLGQGEGTLKPLAFSSPEQPTTERLTDLQHGGQNETGVNIAYVRFTFTTLPLLASSHGSNTQSLCSSNVDPFTALRHPTPLSSSNSFPFTNLITCR